MSRNKNKELSASENYIEGDKLWYQYKEGLAWHGLALVICQRGNAIFMEVRKSFCKRGYCRNA